MHADPDGVILVGEDVDVMIAGADRAELSARLGEESFCLRLTREQRPRVAREERIVDGRIVGGVRATDAEAHRCRDLVREVVPIFALESCCADVRANGGVAAADVEAHADDGDFVVVRRDAADWHDVADVTVGHERGRVGARGDVLELDQRSFVVLPEDFCDSAHGPKVSPCSRVAPQRIDAATPRTRRRARRREHQGDD